METLQESMALMGDTVCMQPSRSCRESQHRKNNDKPSPSKGNEVLRPNKTEDFVVSQSLLSPTNTLSPLSSAMVAVSCCGMDLCSRTVLLEKVETKLNAANYREILEENLLYSRLQEDCGSDSFLSTIT